MSQRLVHFLIIESSHSWCIGGDYNDWLPVNGEGTPSGHSFFYPGLNYLVISALNIIGITHLNTQMYFIRLLNAFWSLLIIYFGYKIAEKYTNCKTANITAWVLTLFWCMPWLSVRNLVEWVCIPFLLWGTWLYIKEEQPAWTKVALSGFIMGLAFSVRYQTIFFLGGFGLALLIMKRWRDAVIFGISALLSITVIQCIPDMILWHRPFAELTEYVTYNWNNATTYFDSPWYNYLLVILGLLLPPISLFLFAGFFYEFRKTTLFLPSFAFLFFHSIFPNKQERFILSIIPFIIILGIIGIYNYHQKHPNKPTLNKWFKYSLIFCIVLNTIALVPVTVHYSKKARVESMTFLSNYPETRYIAIENTLSYGARMAVKAYSDLKRLDYCSIDKGKSWEDNAEFLTNRPIAFVYFEGEENMENRLAEAQILPLHPKFVWKNAILYTLIKKETYELWHSSFAVSDRP